MRASPYPGQRLKTLEDVDVALMRAAQARKKSENDFLVELRSFWLDLSPPNGDPWSKEYRNHWRLAYEALAGKKYVVENEYFDFDVEYHSVHPYPFCTEDYRVVSNQLIAIGSIINSLALPPRSSILEMGAGWGNTSLFLAAMGYEVTVLDINEKYGDLICKRARGMGVNVSYECRAFEGAISLNKKYDCVLFFESFHHSNDHLGLLDTIPTLLNRNGILALAGEPMNEALPYEWGLNPAGEALWQIRQHGWFELVFRESYLLDTLRRKGFFVECFGVSGNPASKTLVCRKPPA